MGKEPTEPTVQDVLDAMSRLTELTERLQKKVVRYERELAERDDQVDMLQQWLDEINVALGSLGGTTQQDRLDQVQELKEEAASQKKAAQFWCERAMEYAASVEDETR